VLSPGANIAVILASFAAFKCMLNREELRPVISPNLIQSKLANQNMIKVSIPENGS
ncbi:ThiF family adenylyltransferase, partial [Bacillus pseudomycoides]|nr:ThiF family adenylyltransferase [Bacillus pseudomycoides]